MQATIVQLEATVLRLQGQNKDLKEAFTKMRDQLRIEQITLENERGESFIVMMEF